MLHGMTGLRMESTSHSFIAESKARIIEHKAIHVVLPVHPCLATQHHRTEFAGFCFKIEYPRPEVCAARWFVKHLKDRRTAVK